jgi:hypothetical protein
MHFETDEASIQSDTYIDSLLGGHARLPVPLLLSHDVPAQSIRQVIRLLESGLPRFHPSFLFEERVAEQLRAASADLASATDEAAVVDRRLLVGGALASGLSIGAAAMLAWRRRHE